MTTMSMLLASLLVASSVADACSSGSTLTPAGPGPTVVRITPSPVSVGVTVTITGTGFAATGNAVKISRGYLLNLKSADGQTITFTLPEGLELCPPNTQVCAQAFMMLGPGEYDLAVVTPQGTSNAIKLTVKE